MNEKKVYEPAEMKVVSLDRDLLITSGGTLGENDWDEIGFNQI